MNDPASDLLQLAVDNARSEFLPAADTARSVVSAPAPCHRGECGRCENCATFDEHGIPEPREREFRAGFAIVAEPIIDRDGRCACCGAETFTDGWCFDGCEMDIVTETNEPFVWCLTHGELPKRGPRPAMLDRLTGRWAEYR